MIGRCGRIVVLPGVSRDVAQCQCLNDLQMSKAEFQDARRQHAAPMVSMEFKSGLPVHAEGLPGFWIRCASSRMQAAKCFQASLSGLKLGESAAFLLDQVILHTTYAFRSSENALPIRCAFAK